MARPSKQETPTSEMESCNSHCKNPQPGGWLGLTPWKTLTSSFLCRLNWRTPAWVNLLRLLKDLGTASFPQNFGHCTQSEGQRLGTSLDDKLRAMFKKC